MPLEKIRQLFGEEDEEISYLKMDIEGHEIPLLTSWTEESLKNVQQVHI